MKAGAALLALALLSALPAGPVHAQRLLQGPELEYALQPIAHLPDRDILDILTGGSNPDLAHTYAARPSEVWRVINQFRGGASGSGQVIVVQPRPPRRHHHRDEPPPNPNGPPSPAVQMQQGNTPSPAVRMQREREAKKAAP